jgi:hypothetical protein
MSVFIFLFKSQILVMNLILEWVKVVSSKTLAKFLI